MTGTDQGEYNFKVPVCHRIDAPSTMHGNEQEGFTASIRLEPAQRYKIYGRVANFLGKALAFAKGVSWRQIRTIDAMDAMDSTEAIGAITILGSCDPENAGIVSAQVDMEARDSGLEQPRLDKQEVVLASTMVAAAEYITTKVCPDCPARAICGDRVELEGGSRLWKTRH